MTITITLMAAIILGALFGFGFTTLFWILMKQQDRSISKHKDEKEYIYEFYLDEDDDRVK